MLHVIIFLRLILVLYFCLEFTGSGNDLVWPTSTTTMVPSTTSTVRPSTAKEAEVTAQRGPTTAGELPAAVHELSTKADESSQTTTKMLDLPVTKLITDPIVTTDLLHHSSAVPKATTMGNLPDKVTHTEEVTEGVTKVVTEDATEDVTKAVTGVATEDVTKVVDEGITEAVTKAVTKDATEDVTKTVAEGVTEDVTEAVTEAVTKDVTEAVTKVVTKEAKDTPVTVASTKAAETTKPSVPTKPVTKATNPAAVSTPKAFVVSGPFDCTCSLGFENAGSHHLLRDFGSLIPRGPFTISVPSGPQACQTAQRKCDDFCKLGKSITWSF